MNTLPYVIERSKEQGRYMFTLRNTTKDWVVTSTFSQSPIAPEWIRDRQAVLNSTAFCDPNRLG